jgi:hypothetical protein
MSNNSWRKCDACLKTKLIDGGCELSILNWLCATCWARYTQKRFKL